MKRVISAKTVLGFGKYAGYSLMEVFDIDLKYIDWCLTTDIFEMEKETYEYYCKRMKLLAEIEKLILKNFKGKDYYPQKRKK